MAEERKFTSLRDLVDQKGRVDQESTSHGHDAFMPVAVQVPQKNGSVAVRGQVDPVPNGQKSSRGRILLFLPTKERVTVVREKVGQSYKGDWLHEVITREGHQFLALQKQLKTL